MVDRYKIYRYFNDDRPTRLMFSGLTLEEAQFHCNDKKTHKLEHTEGDWFDGYKRE